MQPQVAPPGQALRFDGRSVIAAGLCVLALFFDVTGWLFAITGIVLLRRAVFSRSIKLLLAALAIGPKILFTGVRVMYAPEGISFPIEPRNLATSPSLWTWCILLAALGVLLAVMPQRAVRRSVLVGLGLVLVTGGAVVLLGLMEGFHRIDDAGGGRWALRHAARGNVAVFRASEVASIVATERRRTRGPRDYSVRVTLTDGRSYSVTARSITALDELRKFATTAGLPAGRARIDGWTNGASGFSLKDCVGTYELADKSAKFEFWLEEERLKGKETEGTRTRVLQNIKVSETGHVEYKPASYVEASQQKPGTLSFSFGYSAGGETGRFVDGGFECGLKKYSKR